MIDIFALVVSHGSMALIALLLLRRTDLDQDPPPGGTGADDA